MIRCVTDIEDLSEIIDNYSYLTTIVYFHEAIGHKISEQTNNKWKGYETIENTIIDDISKLNMGVLSSMMTIRCIGCKVEFLTYLIQLWSCGYCRTVCNNCYYKNENKYKYGYG